MREQRCETCRFWHDTEDGVGYCRRRAPSASMAGRSPEDEARWVLWPETPTEAWCGEWEPGEAQHREGFDIIPRAKAPGECHE